MSPVPRIIHFETGAFGEAVIVLGSHDNTSGVSVLMARLFGVRGCLQGW